MVSSEQFIEKIEQILKYYNLSASIFSEKIGVQRSSLSHLLSGRNKPSLDFVIKIVEEFPEVDLYWFLFNKGQFPKEELKTEMVDENRVFEKNNFEIQNTAINSREVLPLDLFNSEMEEIEIENNNNENKPQNKLDNTSYEIPQNTTTTISEVKNRDFDIKDEKENATIIEKSIPHIISETKQPSKVKKILLIYEDGFFEEYNYR
jgi:transcriptional regulator with XRE-family HTH domain